MNAWKNSWRLVGATIWIITFLIVLGWGVWRFGERVGLIENAQKLMVFLLVFTLGDLKADNEEESVLSKAWLHASLKSFQADLDHRYKAKVVLYPGTFLEFLSATENQIKIGCVHWNHAYTPGGIERDTRYQKVLAARGIEVQTHRGNVLHEPWDVHETTFIESFSAFQRLYFDQLTQTKSLDYPKEVKTETIKGLPYGTLKDLKLALDADRYAALLDHWDISEKAGREMLKAFVKERLQHFEDSCEIPSVQATSKLSPYIMCGQISVRWIWEICEAAGGEEAKTFLNQLLWREFATYSLFHNPELSTEPFAKDFQNFPWKSDSALILAWKEGRTGYPLIDAGMRELKASGWVHNRVRLVVSSFLVKNLGIRWQEGSGYFQANMIDADLALNAINWQLVTGCGVDSYPFSRILNPVSQGEKFDPEGIYVSHWVPELRNLPEKWIHKPWEAPADVLKKAGIALGETYPKPVVDFHESKTWALDAFHGLINPGEFEQAG
ncbi:MAG: deoxyribodipyrimidine photo-lyase [Proteobacteria bacterium]|nr:MAG: deoxyribodipyrimidine photo-lyase [Pseudomonadota bacterium]